MLRLLMLDDESSRHEKVSLALTRCIQTHCTTPEELSAALRSVSFDVVLLDHDLGQAETGLDCVRDNIHHFAKAFVVVHSNNKPGADSMIGCLRESGIPCEHIPFTSERLIQALLDAGF